MSRDTILNVRTGRMTWSEARSGPLAGTTAFWADLDGAHLASPPAAAPLTSTVWAWNDERLVRVRLDGQDAHLAVRVLNGDEPALVTTLPWPVDDGRLRQLRLAPDTTPDLRHVRWQQVVDDAPGERGSITFIRTLTPRLSPGGGVTSC